MSKALEDFSFLDVYYGERLDEVVTIDPNIVLINIEDSQRLEIANALVEVLKEEPKVVGFDIILEQLENTAADSALFRLLNHKKVVSGYVLDVNGVTSNHPFFQGEGAAGFVNFNFGYQDAVVREYAGYYEQPKKLHSAFSVALAKKFLSKKNWEKRNLGQELASTRVINYQGNYERFLNFTIAEFMALSNKSIIKDKAVLIGYVLGCGSAFITAILIDRSPFLQRGLLPIGNLVSALPIIGVAPIMVMWFGFDWQSKAAVVIIMTFFPMLVNTVAGLSITSSIEKDMMKTYAASYWQSLIKLRLPSALPFIFNALKINSTLAMIGAIVAEFFGSPSKGMGFRIATEVGQEPCGIDNAQVRCAHFIGKPVGGYEFVHYASSVIEGRFGRVRPG